MHWNVGRVTRPDRVPGTMMKRRKKVVMTFPSQNREHEVLQEIEQFLKALNSYPDRVQREPQLSFHEHMFRIAISEQSVADRNRN